MKWFLKILIIQFLVFPTAWGIDEKDIPPPPMPDYMKDKGYQPAEASERSPSSTQGEQEDVPYEDVKREFLQAGDEDLETPEVTAVDDVQTGDIEEGAAEPAVHSPKMVLEDPVEEEKVDPVNAVEESVPEFEQAEISDPQTEQVRDEYLQSGKQELQEEVQEYQPEEDDAPSELASVEQKLEQAEEQAEQSLEQKDRDVSGLKPFKAGMYKFTKECTMYQEDSSFSDKAGVISAGRKLWIDPHSTNWRKAYKKSGEVYISADCLTK